MMKTLPVKFDDEILHREFKKYSVVLGKSMNEIIIDLITACINMNDGEEHVRTPGNRKIKRGD
ncbi:MAG: hypothetical protein GF353_02320 [Candidatus Lokiarchaeota archaeon]|nr:hypothetical protein [Candidatus Lokiarchaeota archaeon]